MDYTPRFEMVDTISSGDFATVYRARDLELGREVAIKQIHSQFLSDPTQLERYWREAQLLASLQHPNVLTVYDIVRSRGWLILELLCGSLEQTARTTPIDLDRLQTVMLCCLYGLDFLHANGILHGDVKPSNLLLDAQGRVKLGDFGLARRATSEQGSLLKGTTKYMAPELISDQFGPVGPASDLYSLGFSAYELMCGPQFETLFPGLNTFGRDRQTAWLMWHATLDRRLPEISRVLEGVPESLSQVVERLVAKDPSKRYQTAREAIEDLERSRSTPRDAGSRKADAPASSGNGNKRRRAAIACALASSTMLALWLLLPSPPTPAETTRPPAIEGVIRMIDPERRIVVLDLPDGNPLELQNLTSEDRFFVNDKRALLGELQHRDRVTIQYVRGGDGRKIAEFYATRPQIAEGTLASIDSASGTLRLAIGTNGQQLSVRVPGTVTISFNGQETLGERPVELADLSAGDRVTVQHVAEKTGHAAVAVAVQRIVELHGVIRGLDLQKGMLTFETGEGPQAEMYKLAVAPDCKVRVNNSNKTDGRLLAIADIRPGDQATIEQDVHVVSIDATRVLTEPGFVEAVQPQILTVQIEGNSRPRNFVVDATCKITLFEEQTTLGELRRGDLVDVSHDALSPHIPNPRALAIAARRPEDRSRWAIVIGVQNYDDRSLGIAPTVGADAQLVRDALVKRHAVPAEQTLALADPSLVRLEQGIGAILGRIQTTDQLIVYFAGQASLDANGTAYLAPKEFRRDHAGATGLSLQALVDQLEACQAGEKLFILDAYQADSSINPQETHLSSAELLETLHLPMRTVTAIASCSEGQHGQSLPSRNVGLFAATLADGYSGLADKNRDDRLETTELAAFLNASMAAARMPQGQTAKLFLPDDSPPRLSDEAKQAIRSLAAATQPNDVNLGKVRAELNAAEKVAGQEPEPRLLFGLALLRSREWADAEQLFLDLGLKNPELTSPLQGLAWARFGRRDYTGGVRALVELVEKVPKTKTPGQIYRDDAQQLFSWAGQLREYVAAAEESRAVADSLLQRLDAAVAAHEAAAGILYQQGRSATQAVMQDFDTRIASGENDAIRIKAKVERRNLRHYAVFPYDAAIQGVLSRLN